MSRNKLAFLHTSPVHIETFDRLLEKHKHDIPAQHFVDDSLLQDAIQSGITPELKQRIIDMIQDIETDARVILCTCSTIGGVVEEFNRVSVVPIIRLDRPMVEQAIANGTKIVIVATIASTIAPTRHLVEEVAQAKRQDIEIIESIVPKAWSKFEGGDMAGYIDAIADHLHNIAHHGNVILLAQASMASAIEQCQDIAIPILSSPEPGLEAAIRLYAEKMP